VSYRTSPHRGAGKLAVVEGHLAAGKLGAFEGHVAAGELGEGEGHRGAGELGVVEGDRAAGNVAPRNTPPFEDGGVLSRFSPTPTRRRIRLVKVLADDPDNRVPDFPLALPFMQVWRSSGQPSASRAIAYTPARRTAAFSCPSCSAAVVYRVVSCSASDLRATAEDPRSVGGAGYRPVVGKPDNADGCNHFCGSRRPLGYRPGMAPINTAI
jgi:hypothetical protein